jgi:feruloyl esterase
MAWLHIPFALIAQSVVALTGAPPDNCAALARLAIPDVTVSSAASVPQGAFTPPGGGPSLTVPAFCRVVGVARPTSDSSIGFEVWLPEKAAWNGKFEGVGTHAFQGAVSFDAMAAALQRGYATASTDTGHVKDDLRFADGHPEKVIDWGYRAVHVTTDIAKLVIRNFEGRLPILSYFQGCDTGGHQALMEAQRYSADYDGIIAGNPAADRTNEIVGYLGVWLATHDRDGAVLLPASKLPLVTAAIVSACDDVDGVKDGVIGDPRDCTFNSAALLCTGAEKDNCLTDTELKALRAVYAGTRNPRTGAVIFPGWPVGSEGWGKGGGGGWASMVASKAPRRVDFFRYFAFHNANWDWRSFDFDRDVAAIDENLGFLNANNPDMESFAARGGKLLIYTGWADPILPADDVIRYYDAVGSTMGVKRRTTFSRFYLVPGMGHCSGGPGTTQFDMLSALESWVEKHKAPERIIASRTLDNGQKRTRPLCAYPLTPRWTGKGSSDDAANFECRPVH